ncbi:MAG TPA: hypothetical protein VMP68_24310 [Candidatus Eisenbacteria bacterium]|nr:hypothetical protein [Candidatus Eisenbacteria bacterium]
MSRLLTRGYCLALSLFVTSIFTPAALAQATLTIGLTLGSDSNGEPTYTATVTNTSDLDAPNLTVTYTLPSGELPISPSPSGGCLFTPGYPHLVVVCSISNLNPGESHDFVIAVHPIDTAPQDCTAVATESGGGEASAFITSTITSVGLAEMQVTMTSTNPGKVGEMFTYTVTVTNIQDDDARNVKAFLSLPTGAKFVSATKGCSHSGQAAICKLGQMSPGTSKVLTINVNPTISGWAQATAGLLFTTPDGHFDNNASGNSIWINP